MPKSLLRGAAIAIAACAILVPSAEATTYCAPAAVCRAGEVGLSGVQEALSAAQNHAGDDTVRIGAGTFKSSTGFRYIAGDPENDVAIEGAGSGAAGSVLRADTPAKGDSFAVLDVDGGGASTRITGIRVVAPRPLPPATS